MTLHFGYRVLGISKEEWERQNRAEELTQGQHFGPRVIATQPLSPKEAAAIAINPDWPNQLVAGVPATTAIPDAGAPVQGPALSPEDALLLENRAAAVAQAERFRSLSVTDSLAAIRAIDSGLLLLLAGEHGQKDKPPRKRILEALHDEAAKRGVDLTPFQTALTNAGIVADPGADSEEA
jgi:hypothetical protein